MQSVADRKGRTLAKKRALFQREIPLYVMLLPAVIILIIYHYLPMYGIIIAFQKYNPIAGFFGKQKWIGLGNFRVIFANPLAMRALKNTVIIAFFKIITSIVVPIVFALLLNEVRHNGVKRTVQTVIYLPHFISWVVLGQLFTDLLAMDTGLLNQTLSAIGLKQISFLGSNEWFRSTVIVTNIWKEFGFGTIMYLAAITSIDPSLYEAAEMDGANRFQRMWHVTLPGMSTVIILRMVLSLSHVLNAGFDQIFNMYNANVYQTGDVLETYIYRLGLVDMQYGQATAVGLFKSLVALVFTVAAYYFAYKKYDYHVF